VHERGRGVEIPENGKQEMLTTAAVETCIACNDALEEVLNEIYDTRFGISNPYAVARCASCGLEQTLPRPGMDNLTSLYVEYYNFGGESGTKYTRIREWVFSSIAYRAWLKIDGDISFHTLKGTGRLLDVGCNEGRGLAIYSRNGFEPVGLEVNNRAAQKARGAGYTVYEDLIEQHDPSIGYDAVVLSNVLEHSLDPKDMAVHCYRVLVPGGRIYLSCPNSRSWLRDVFGRFWINWHVPFHIVHFSPDTLAGVLKAAGFSNITIKQRTPALWVSHSVVSKFTFVPAAPTRHLRNPFLIAGLVLFVRLFLFPLLFLGNLIGKGDCLVVTAQKPAK
jgi:SAM-dependent methyltransferase